MSLASATMIAAVVQAYESEIPISSSYPGWWTGGNASNIEIMVFEDMLCSACSASHAIFEDLLAMEWLGGTVK